MTSHVRHRRGTPIPPLIEPGEVHVDAPARQLTAGDIGVAAGVPLPMLAVRYFDARASYAVHEYVVQSGSLYRSLVAVSPGSFNPAQWEVVSGVPGGGGGVGEHTPLHGYGDGANRTLVLHNVSDTITTGNTIDFLNLSGQSNAKIWATGALTDTLRIQASGNIALAPSHIAFDDSGNKVTVDATNVTIKDLGSSGGLVLQTGTSDTSRLTALSFRNAAAAQCANIWTWGTSNGGLWMQSGGPINLVPGQADITGGGTALQVSSSSAHVAIGTASGAFNQGALVVDGGVGVGGEIYANGSIHSNGSLSCGANASIANNSGYINLQCAGDLYLRSPTITRINDNSGAQTVVGGPLTVSGAFAGVAGGVFQNDLTVWRSSQPGIAVIYLGNSGLKGLHFDGTDLHTETMRGVITNDPVIGGHAATKTYVDVRDNAVLAQLANYLPLAGGTLTGRLNSASNGPQITASGNMETIQVLGGAAAGSHAGMTFYNVSTGQGCNFGLSTTDMNFYMGGISHGAAYKFWTSRDFAQPPIGGVRLAYAADARTDSEPAEPFPGAVVTGVSTHFVAAQGDREFARYRYLQVLIGTSWVTVALA
jgi:hypothetical protein